ncbi:MAG TPA: hypothetical protein VMU80_22545 [Bryobacteraceae bacterium]|nr:hypothetical protein [Bryobacteraceae bacterium]
MYAEFGDAEMKKPGLMMFVLAELVSVGYGQGPKAANTPFTLNWSEGKCLGCKIAARLGEIQFVSRSEVWAVGSEDHPGGVNVVVVHSTDAGHTWREVPQSQQYTDPDARLAFSFLDIARGWIAAWGNLAGDPEIIGTRDGGQHWRSLSQQFLQRMQFMDDSHGYGTMGDEFLRTNDGGRSWVKTKIPDIVFIDCMVFLTPDSGWIAGTTGMDGKDLLVFRTVNGGRDWEESRTTPPQPPQRVRDLFFLDQQRGWLTIWNQIGEGTYLYSTVDGGKHWTPDPDLLFQGKDKQASVVRFTSRERGLVFFLEGGQNRLAFTTDGGRHWYRQALPRYVDDCRVFEGDLLCSSAPGFRLLTLHPK